MRTRHNQFKKISGFFAKIATTIVAGAPGRKIFFRPENKSVLQPEEMSFKPDIEKHYHRPKAKPAVEKQTLLKKKKKTKAVR